MTLKQNPDPRTKPVAETELARAGSGIKFDLTKLFKLMEHHRDLDKDLSQGFEKKMLDSAKELIGEVLFVNGQSLELGEPLGAGTRGIVFAARRVGEESFNLALKVGQPYVSSGKAAPLRDSPQRCFEEEVRFLTLLQNDPRVRVPVLHGSSEVVQPGKNENQRIGLILMELVPGERMSRLFRLDHKDGAGTERLELLCAGMLDGIDALLSKKIWIDDAGINNVIVTTDPTRPIVIFDFGAARLKNEDIESARQDTAWFIGSQLRDESTSALRDGVARNSDQTKKTLGLIIRVGTLLANGKLTLKDASKMLRDGSASKS